MLQSSINTSQCGHSRQKHTQTSAIEFCQFCREIRPSNQNSFTQPNKSLCYHHNKTYENICVICGILLCKQCQLLSHPYDHKILSISNFIQKIIDYSEKQGPENYKEAHKNEYINIFKNRQIVAKLERRLKLVTYKQLEFAQQKKQSMAQLKNTIESYSQIIDKLKHALSELQEKIKRFIFNAEKSIDQIYQTKSKIAQKQALCLLYFKDPQKKSSIDIACFVLQHWNELDQTFKQSGLSMTLSSLFKPAGKKKIKKSISNSIQLPNEIDNNDSNIISIFQKKVKKEFFHFTQQINDLIHSQKEELKKEKDNKFQISIFTECDKSPRKGTEPVQKVMKALGSIINRKKDKNANQNKENFTIKLNSSKKSRSNISTTKNSIDLPSKTSCFDQSAYLDQKPKKFILYGGAHNTSLLEIYNVVECPKSTHHKDNNKNGSLSGTSHQQFGLVPSIHDPHSFFVFGGRMHGQPIDCIFQVTCQENKRQLIGHMTQRKSNFGICYQKQLDQKVQKIKVYIVGGADEDGDSLRTFEMTQIQQNICKLKLELGIKHTKMEPINIKRKMLSVAIHKNYLYAIGGANESYRALNSVERISLQQPLQSQKWEQIGDLNEERCMHSSISIESGLYCLGGWNQIHFLDSVQKLDEGYLIFRTVFRMKESRSLFGVSSYQKNEKIIVFGGLNDKDSLDTCEVIDPGKKISLILPKKLSAPNFYFGCLPDISANFD